VVGLVRKDKVSPEVVTRLERNSPFGRVLAAGVRNLNAPRDVMKESIEEAGAAVVHDLEKFMTTLGTIASAAPLLGLFGTVVGMIEIFGSQTASGAGNPAQMAAGISIALYNTGFGLAIAIPSLIFYRHFRRMIDNFVNDMQVGAVKFVDVVQGERRA
jgi:biopolymer transport protein ExbB